MDLAPKRIHVPPAGPTMITGENRVPFLTNRVLAINMSFIMFSKHFSDVSVVTKKKKKNPLKYRRESPGLTKTKHGPEVARW